MRNRFWAAFGNLLSRLRRRAASRLAPPGFDQAQDRRPVYVIDAERHPENYFTCSGCGEGPWHNSWARIEIGRGRYRMPRHPLGGCCSGAD